MVRVDRAQQRLGGACGCRPRFAGKHFAYRHRRAATGWRSAQQVLARWRRFGSVGSDLTETLETEGIPVRLDQTSGRSERTIW
jgi:hypothetical protein